MQPPAKIQVSRPRGLKYFLIRLPLLCQSLLSSHSFTLIHSVSRSSLLSTCVSQNCFQVCSDLPCEGPSFYIRSANVCTPALPLLTAEMNPIQLIDRSNPNENRGRNVLILISPDRRYLPSPSGLPTGIF
ncbi:hypothetical protein AVEN_211739-1 [Araneus ventricosus]|uniref:Uncharacterized protein n=1 Tax=Araneus ventricosus TaxID=182803 RepID=A0A4Y2L6E9_ARAVE|nr:hypothetical protein AVEN_211739-1 [Araneus ventricosus]